MFNILRVKIEASPDYSILNGYFIGKDSTYTIDIVKGEAKYKKRKLTIYTNDYILTPKDIYIRDGFLRDLFNMDIEYNDRRTEVVLKSKSAYPEIQQRNREKYYQKSKETEYIEPTLNLGRTPKIFSLGKLNYRVSSTRFSNQKYYHRYNLFLGSQILGGDLEMSLRGTINKQIKEKDIQGNIKYPFFNNRLIGLVTMGDIQRRSFIGGSLLGIDITNSPPERRYNFGSLSLSTTVQPRQEYIFSATGTPSIYIAAANETTFTAKFPFYFGFNEILEKRYDWYGEEQLTRRYVIVPSSMLPPGNFDYKISLGRLRQKYYPWYGAMDLIYGATHYITLGGGFEYADRKFLQEKLYPYTFSTLRIYDNIYAVAEYSPFVKTRATLSWRKWDQKSIDVQFQQFVRNAFFNPRNLKYSSSISSIFPFQVKSTNFQLSGLLTQNTLQQGNEYGYSVGGGVNFEKLTISFSNMKSTHENLKTIFFDSRLAVTIQASAFSTLSLMGQYDHKENRLRSTNLGLTLPISSFLFVNIFVERNFIQQDFIAFASITLLPPFIRSQTSATKSNYGVTLNQVFSGEIIGSLEEADVMFRNRTQKRRGYIQTHAFYDANNNGKLDKDEKYLKDVNIGVDRLGYYGGSVTQKVDDHTYITAGENYRDYVFKIRNRDLEEPFWVPSHERISTKAEPNKLKTLNIPVVYGGIIKGVVNLLSGESASGVPVTLVKDDNIKFKKIVKTGSSGDFEFPVVPPGNYTVTLDNEYLSSVGYISEPLVQTIEVIGTTEQEFIDVQFILKKQ
jgi:hypothetical protein